MKKIVSVMIAGILTVIMSTGAFAAFADMPSGADGVVLQRAIDNGLIQGFEDGTVQPSTPITRAQMATIISRAMNATDKADISKFVDVEADSWYYDAMSKAVFMEAFKGDDKSRLNPNNTITRQEAMIVLSRIFDTPKADVIVLNKFPDNGEVSSWALKEVSSVCAAGYLEGVSALRPLQPMTRLEFAQIMDKIVAEYIDEDGEYTSVKGNVLVRAQNVKLNGIKGVNVYTGDGVNGNVEFIDCDLNDIIVRGGTAIVNSGAYGRIRAIGAKTAVDLKITPGKIMKTGADGKKGVVYAKPGKGIVKTPQVEIDIDMSKK